MWGYLGFSGPCVAMSDFNSTFNSLTANPAFPWQENLYTNWFSKGEMPARCMDASLRVLSENSPIPNCFGHLATRRLFGENALLSGVKRRPLLDQRREALGVGLHPLALQAVVAGRKVRDHPHAHGLRQRALRILSVRGSRTSDVGADGAGVCGRGDRPGKEKVVERRDDKSRATRRARLRACALACVVSTDRIGGDRRAS